MRWRSWHVVIGLVFGVGVVSQAQDAPKPEQQFLAFIKSQAAALRANDRPPADANEWQQRRTKLRENLLKAWGGLGSRLGRHQVCPATSREQAFELLEAEERRRISRGYRPGPL